MRDVGGPKQGKTPGSGGNQRPSGPRAVLDALRGVPERMRRPESLLMVLAIMASLGMHMPPYLGLGALADYFEEQERLHKKEDLPPVSIDVVSTPEPPQAKPEPPPEPKAEAPKPKPKKKEELKKEKQEQLAQKEPEKPKAELAIQPQPQLEPPPPPPAQRKQSITQKSQDPNVEPPPDARFMADESQRVLEESVASVTSETRDDPKPQAAAPMGAEAERAGDSRQDEKGAQKGAEEEQQQQAATRQRQPMAEPPPEGEPTPLPSQSPRTPAPRAEAPKEVIIRDPLGTFVLAPSEPHQHDHQGGGPQGAGGKGPNLKVNWRAFEETFGAEQLAMDRLPREAKRRGAGREKRWEEFRAAIENYVEGVKPGNTTALNAAADPFAAYLAAFHRNLHAEFAYDFVASLPMAGELANPMLVTKVEIVINADGTLDRVGVVKSSGNLMFDFGAFNAVQRGSPYPPTPEKIRSPDGRVYMRWALHRDQNMCGTWLAEPYILKSAPRSPNDPPQDNMSPFLPGRGRGGEHGSNEEPKRGGGKAPPGKTPAVAPGETLGQRTFRVQPARG